MKHASTNNIQNQHDDEYSHVQACTDGILHREERDAVELVRAPPSCGSQAAGAGAKTLHSPCVYGLFDCRRGRHDNVPSKNCQVPEPTSACRHLGCATALFCYRLLLHLLLGFLPHHLHLGVRRFHSVQYLFQFRSQFRSEFDSAISQAHRQTQVAQHSIGYTYFPPPRCLQVVNPGILLVVSKRHDEFVSEVRVSLKAM